MLAKKFVFAHVRPTKFVSGQHVVINEFLSAHVRSKKFVSNLVRFKKFVSDHVRSKKFVSNHVRSKKFVSDHVRSKNVRSRSGLLKCVEKIVRFQIEICCGDFRPK